MTNLSTELFNLTKWNNIYAFELNAIVGFYLNCIKNKKYVGFTYSEKEEDI